jgi:hypothetical protein
MECPILAHFRVNLVHRLLDILPIALFGVPGPIVNQGLGQVVRFEMSDAEPPEAVEALTKACEDRRDRLWIARAITSLPVPVSPVITTVESEGATFALLNVNRQTVRPR